MLPRMVPPTESTTSVILASVVPSTKIISTWSS